MLLDLVGRHPFLATGDLAEVLRWSPAAVRRRRDGLVGAGLLRLLDPAGAAARVAAGDGLAELTLDGVAFVLLHRHALGADLRAGLKPCLRAA